MIYVNFFTISVELNFDMKFHSNYSDFKHFETLSNFIFGIDILIKFDLAYYKDGNCVKKRMKIMKNYFKSDFLYDFITFTALICSSCYEVTFPFNCFPVLFFAQYRNIGKIYNDIEQFLKFNEFCDFFELTLVLFKTICITHLFACVWHSISYYQLDKNSQTWLGSLTFISVNSVWYEKYLLSIYWALTTLVTVGYGDITPKNLYETAFCSFTLLCGTLVFGYCMNTVGFILQKKHEKQKELKFFY